MSGRRTRTGLLCRLADEKQGGIVMTPGCPARVEIAASITLDEHARRVREMSALAPIASQL